MIECVIRGRGSILILKDRVAGKMKKVEVNFTDSELAANRNPELTSNAPESMRMLINLRLANAIKTLYAE